MAIFEYRGRTASGDPVSGRMEAASSAAVAGDLADKGITPLAIGRGEATGSELLERIERWRALRRISLTDTIMLCRQMAALTGAGVPITRALRGLSETVRNPELARILAEVAEQLEKGHDLASALGRHPRIFSNLFVSVIHIGESSGRLVESFDQLYHYQTLEEETRRRIKGALRYPTMVLISIGVALAVINAFVIPPFAKLFSSFGADLPLATRVLIGSSEAFSRFWHVGAFAVLLGVWLVRRWLQTPEGRLQWDHRQLQLPVIGSILERAVMARFARTLAITLGAGLPITQCLSICARTVDNEHVATRVLGMRSAIESGDSLTAAAHASGMFPPLLIQMISVGEETGAVEETLGEVASYYERDVDYDLKRLGEAIEPILLIFVGVMVLGLALGVYLPMWEMASAARGH